MDIERAFARKAKLEERLRRIEETGHPGLMPAVSGHKTCPKHGDYIANGGPCPVCEGEPKGRRYEAVLHALADAGVIQPGYADASIERGATFIRLPWVRKTPAADKEPAPF